VHYCFLEPAGPVAVSTPIDAEAPLAAFAPDFPVFAWDEREMAGERSIRFTAMADARPFFAVGGAMPDPVVAHGEGVMQIVVGPVHAGIIEPGRFTFSSGGETVVHLDAQLGYAHRGIERMLEGRGAVDAAPRVARICGTCSAARSHAYALALEALAGIRVDSRAAFGRVALCELERVVNHLGDLAASASSAGWMPGFVRGMTLKERAMRACATASGHRLLFDAIVPGGLGDDALHDVTGLREEIAGLRIDAEAYANALFGNGSVISRWRGAGVVPEATAAACGAVGPAHRASGGGRDVRTFAPYGAYGDLGVGVARAAGGDAFARARIKRDELRESLRLIDAALARVDDGPQRRAVGRLEPGTARACVEGPRGAEMVAVHVDGAGCIERFHAISASYRNWPIVARAMDGNIVPDFPLVNKSFNLCYACADR
jgi:Ni,Fe-hydrogenase III large subunit